MELIIISFAATTALLLGHFAIVVRNWLSR
jgi:hypothetical protein